MTYPARDRFSHELDSIRDQGLYKIERIIATPQSSSIRTADGREVLNFCANNYLGLADDAQIIQAAKDALDTHGFGLASVRFICGTQDLHKQLEATIATFSAPTMRFCIRVASMRMAACSRRSSAMRTR